MTPAEDAERSLQLADAAQAAFDVESVVTHLSAAIRSLTVAGQPRAAAMACARLGDALANGMGNLTAARAWFSRAAAMLADEPPCIEQGWVAVAAMGCDVGDPDELLACAELALGLARRFGDVNLETKALADGGLAHVQAGRVAEGMAMLDEAMALVCGPADDADVAGKSACSFFTACYYSADFDRAGSWSDLMRSRGIIGPDVGAPIFLSNHCDAVQASLLCELGRWGDAEALLTRAVADFEAAVGQPGWHPTIMLADIRIRQGRHADAEMLLLGKDQSYEALLPTSRLHLSRGDHDLAAAAARRGLRAIAADRLRAMELLTVLIDAELGRGDLAAAEEACADLDERVRGLDNPILCARSAVARARVLTASGAPDAAVALLEEALAGLREAGSPYQRIRLLVALARLHDQLGDRASAVLDAKAALSTLAGLDIVLEPDDHALLEALSGATETRPEVAPCTLARDGKWWTVSCGTTTARLRDTKGMRYLAVLLGTPGVERHALDLVDRIEGVAAAGEVDRRALGDAGAVLDGAARTAYRRRIEELRAECDERLDAGDLQGAESRQAELDQLVGQLAQAFGLGGRSRRASSSAERARLNVTRALRAAIANITDAVPAGGELLDRRVRTGLYCAYEPADGEARWIVQSTVNEMTGS